MNVSGRFQINDVTGLNPVPAIAVVRPTSIEDVQEALQRSEGPVSIGGGHFSMGGQTASPGSVHFDMRGLTGVVSFSPLAKTIRVYAGTRWCDMQHFLDPHDLAVKIMQTYANFTVGGSLSVNCHGRYMGLGPVIMSVRRIKVVLPDGSLVEASSEENSEIFYGAVGGYGGLGIIVEAELDVAENTRIERKSRKLQTSEYLDYFKRNIRHDPDAVFHNADLYPPHYSTLLAVTWSQTARAATHRQRLQRLKVHHAIEKYMMWSVTEWPLGKQRREFIIDPLIYMKRKVHWRNYEAGYDVAELEPVSRKNSTYVLQEYFVPIDQFVDFTRRMSDILQRHRVNAVNVSVRHALADPGSYLAWGREECFAFVLYYKQRTRDNAKTRVGVWTRELVEAAIACDGTYYLPYQVHPTVDQFHRAYPRARELFALKDKLDPNYRLRNVLWDTYYRPTETTGEAESDSEFKSVFVTVEGRDAFYRFLQTVFHLYPEDRFHQLLQDETAKGADDETIYRTVQTRLPSIKPRLSELTYAIPALRTQKQEMLRQTLELLGGRKAVHGYLEIGSTGRYISALRKAVKVTGPIYLVNEFAPSNSPVDILERGGLRKIGTFIENSDYRPITAEEIGDSSIEIATCYVGLHHAAPDVLGAFMASIYRTLKPGGLFILRDHDVPTPEMWTFVALVHSVFNAGTGEPWEVNAAEPRFFDSLEHWSSVLVAQGFVDTGARLLQANDPSDNTLMSFRKPT